MDKEFQEDYKHCSRGVLAYQGNPTVSCDGAFLAHLTDRLGQSVRSLVLTIGKYDVGAPLDDETFCLARSILFVLAECRRLEAHPELYPNEELQQRFMEYVVTTVETLSKLQHILKKASEFTCRLRSEVPTEMSPHNVDGGIVGPAYRSKIHPHARTEKPQWSKWLGNDQTIVAGLNMASPVQQRFPTAALKILARHQSVYDKLEADFDVKSAVMRTQPKPVEVLSRASGEDYASLIEAERRLNQRARANFMTGEKKPYDKTGLITLEELNTMVQIMQGRRPSEATSIVNTMVILRG